VILTVMHVECGQFLIFSAQFHYEVVSMKMLLSICAALLLSFSAATAFAATDVTGTWTAKMAGPNGNDIQLTFTFKQDGAKLTGTMGGPMGDPMEFTDGKVDGDKISFSMSFNGMTIKHEGVITGDTIKLTTKAEGGGFPGSEMTLTRNK
jgi:hypothetical protein